MMFDGSIIFSESFCMSWGIPGSIVRFIHVAGTNGKGSVLVQKAIVRMEAKGLHGPAVFEIETAIAFLYFRKKRKILESWRKNRFSGIMQRNETER